MRRFLIPALALFFIFSGSALAADAANVPGAKIGVVDMQTIAMDCDAAKEFKEEMETKYGKERTSLEKQGQSLKKQAESLKGPKVSEDKKVAYIKARQKLEQNTRNLVRKVEQDEVKFRQDLVSLVFNATYEVAKAKGYTFVVDVTGGGVLYADPSMDLTKEVLAQVNKIYQDNQSKQDGKAAAPAADSAKKDAPKK